MDVFKIKMSKLVVFQSWPHKNGGGFVSVSLKSTLAKEVDTFLYVFGRYWAAPGAANLGIILDGLRNFGHRNGYNGTGHLAFFGDAFECSVMSAQQALQINQHDELDNISFLNGLSFWGNLCLGSCLGGESLNFHLWQRLDAWRTRALRLSCRRSWRQLGASQRATPPCPPSDPKRVTSQVWAGHLSHSWGETVGSQQSCKFPNSRH